MVIIAFSIGTVRSIGYRGVVNHNIRAAPAYSQHPIHAIIPIQRYVVNIDIASLYPDHIPAEPAGSGLNDRCLAIADNGSIRPYRQCPGRVNDIHPVREINRILALGCLQQCSLLRVLAGGD